MIINLYCMCTAKIFLFSLLVVYLGSYYELYHCVWCFHFVVYMWFNLIQDCDKKRKDKVIPILNYIIRHYTMKAYGGVEVHASTAPPSLMCVIMWQWVVSFMLLPLYPMNRAPGTLWIGGWVGPRDEERKVSFPFGESDPSYQAHSLVSMPGELSLRLRTVLRMYLWIKHSNANIYKQS